jgi:hypothetical protein
MGKQIKKRILPKDKKKKTLKVSHLQNSIYYFLQGVSIIQQDSGYRLLVMHQGRLLDDATYKTVRGARIGFSRRYKYKLWDKGVEPKWSPFYAPEEKVLRRDVEPLRQHSSVLLVEN